MSERNNEDAEADLRDASRVSSGRDAATRDILHNDRRRAHDNGATLPTESFSNAQIDLYVNEESEGDSVGNFKLIERLGTGGFGTVWLAEQEKPVRRNVALKVIKLGMDTREVIARFERERQALAVMDHPNIARVFDAGATPLGRPFFVMELVRGDRITDYCDRHELAIAERLKLFISVCQAVQHAHQKGIIHRDIKPSNILVTTHDGQPVPKVIDFGVAKATQQLITDTSVVTQFEAMIGTPSYMSPEQAGGELDVDTRSDIYSLGVLLFELLTGRTPFDPKQLTESGIDTMRRIIREEEPRKPSTVLSNLDEATLIETARCRHTETPRLVRTIRGDLDWIVLKALEKDRVRRYESATAFAEDVARHLRFETVVARPPSRAYRFGRLVRRNKLVFVAATIVSFTLIAGVAVSLAMYVREKRARDAAKTEAEKSAQVAKFLGEMLESVGPSVARGRDTTLMREILDKAAVRICSDLKNQPDVDAQLRMTIGNAYRDIGKIDDAESMLRAALAIRLGTRGNLDTVVALSLNNLANVLSDEGKLSEAEVLHRKALAMYRQMFGDKNECVARSLNNLANTLMSEHKFAESEEHHRQALEMYKQLLGDENEYVARSLLNMSTVLAEEGKLGEAETGLRASLAMQRKLPGGGTPDLSRTLGNLATLLRVEGKMSEAEDMQREAFASTQKLFGDDHPFTTTQRLNLAMLLRTNGKLPESEKLFRDALAARRKVLGNAHRDTIATVSALADLLRSEGKTDEAENLSREESEARKNLRDSKQSST